MKTTAKRIGLAIVGAGRVGGFRAEIAARYPSVDWIGIAETHPQRGEALKEKINADFLTNDFRVLLNRPEVTAVIVATSDDQHADPVLLACDRLLPVLVEKPIATNITQSEAILEHIDKTNNEVLVGYTQRFRRRWLTMKEKIHSGALGDVSVVTSRGLMNRLMAIQSYERAGNIAAECSPMVVSGTHVIDLVMWCMQGRTPVECYARSVDKLLGPLYGGVDATVATIVFDDGALYHLSHCWSLPVAWPGAVYSLELSVTGKDGVLTVDDTHRDMVMAVSSPQNEGHTPDNSRLVDFLGSYLPGDVALGEIWGPLREETECWLTHLSLGSPIHAATAREAHNNLLLTKAIDQSALERKPIDVHLLSALG